jgi:hypothetical protein
MAKARSAIIVGAIEKGGSGRASATLPNASDVQPLVDLAADRTLERSWWKWWPFRPKRNYTIFGGDDDLRVRVQTKHSGIVVWDGTAKTVTIKTNTWVKKRFAKADETV